MDIQLSTLKTNPAKYFDLAKSFDITVTRRGKILGRIISEEKAADYEKRKAFDELMAFSKLPSGLPEEYRDPNYDPNYDLLREAAYRDRGLLE
ncbi:hypothetical protein FACS1894217_06440 [Clostridia bacterium]|nr:hypothetical protein FACS1894217_06440 [Clostridia bacterium]